jgi:hypothetical protein
VIAAAVAVIAMGGGLARANEKIGFSLENVGTTPISEATFQPLPIGTVVPSVEGTDAAGNPIEGSPLEALATSTGVATNNAFFLLGSQELPDGTTQDAMFLIFGYQPNPAYDPADPASQPFIPAVDAAGNQTGMLEPGGRFEFELTLADAASAGLIVPTVSELSLGTLIQASGPEESPGPEAWAGAPDGGLGEVTTIPEPSAVVLWGVVAGLGAVAARRRLAGR